MRLSTIKLAGFKSFVEPTKIPFPDQMTCVVGPNGCGKSNVIDAVRWVLGESSAKNLRGDAMTDVIFNGSTNRKAISQASVELIFDNDSADFANTFASRNQIAIKRLVTRDGQSLYYLNGSKCRKRDITDIFLGTGLGPRSYAIIEQGMISRLIESKPQELRVFLEEAAGVSKYKERRRETQTRIKSTRENLERLLDVRKELKSQLDKLAVQSQDAKKYRELKAQERVLKGQVAVLKWQKLHQQQNEKGRQIAELNEQINFFHTAHVGHDDVLASLEAQVQGKQDSLADLQQQQHALHTELTRAEQQQINIKQQQQTLQHSLAELQQRETQSLAAKTQQQTVCDQQHETLQQAIANSELSQEQVAELSLKTERLRELKQQHTANWQTLNEQQQQLHTKQLAQANQIQQLSQSAQHVKQQREQLEQQIAALHADNLQQQLSDLQHTQQAQTQQLANKQTAHSKCQAAAAQQQNQLTAAEQQCQQLTQQVNELKASIAGLKSTLGLEDDNEAPHTLLSQLTVTAGFEHIVEQALQSFQQLTVSDKVQPNSVWQASKNAPQRVAQLSLANYITAGVYPEYLARIAYSENGSLAALDDDYYLAVMDKQGALHGRNWHLNGDKNAANSLLLKHQQLHTKTTQLTELNQQLQDAQDVLATHQQAHKQLAAEQTALKDAIHQLAQTIAVASTRSDMLQQQVAQQQLQLEKLQQQQQQLTEQLTAIEADLVAQKKQHSLLDEQRLKGSDELEAANTTRLQTDKDHSEALSRLEQYKTQAHQASLNEQRARSEWQLSHTKLNHAEQEYSNALHGAQQQQAQLEALRQPAQQLADNIAQLLQQHASGEQQQAQLNDKLAHAKEALSAKQASLKHSQGELEALQQQHQKLSLEEQSVAIKAQLALEPLAELKQTLQLVLEELPDSLSVAAAQNQLTSIANQLEKLGAVNLAAIDEFDQAKARSEYLDNQLDDLTKALSTLEGAIRKIDLETKTRFKATFDQVNHDFGELFPKVFGGGSAYLALTSDDLLESGVSIMARPPGKKNSTIHLLSGGEKALSALSLVFSIFRLNPAPFCMLDEVDAPLDDANVVRFCRLVEEMSQSVQFIYISHNKIAMEMAGRLTGVTMAEPGVSRVVAVDIEQAVQLAHA